MLTSVGARLWPPARSRYWQPAFGPMLALQTICARCQLAMSVKPRVAHPSGSKLVGFVSHADCAVYMLYREFAS